MSEYQCYEFVALDRPLTAEQMGELREISSRAKISPVRFWNEYHWGDLQADPAVLMERYFDAHLYFASWGTHRLMLRLPKARVDVERLEAYLVGARSACLAVADDHVVLDLGSDSDEYDRDDDSHTWLGALSPLRGELLRDDLRPAYLAWLLMVQAEGVDEDDVEPPVPEGRTDLTGAQAAMIEYLRIDPDLVTAAAARSAALPDDGAAFRRWVAGLTPRDKSAWLRRAAEEPDLAIGTEMLRAFRATRGAPRASAPRTVSQLRALAEERRSER